MTAHLNPDRTFLHFLHIDTEHPGGESTLTIRLSHNPDPASQTLELRFTGISGLKLQDFGGGFHQFLHLQAQDIADNQLDRIRWHVKEHENAAIEFRCLDIESRDVNS